MPSTIDSLKWAEKNLKKKLSEPADAKQNMSDAYNPEEAPQYILPADMMEDEETASTLKSAHTDTRAPHVVAVVVVRVVCSY